MSAIAGILADRGFQVSGSDPRDNAVLQDLRARGVRVFREQSAATIDAIRSGTAERPLVVVSSAVPSGNAELQEARRAGLTVLHRSDVLAALIAGQDAVAVAGSHGKTTTSTLVASLLHATDHDPTAVIGGIVPAFGSNGRNGNGPLLVAEADESDGTLVKFQAWLGVITNLELDHTDHYPDLAALIATVQRFGRMLGVKYIFTGKITSVDERLNKVRRVQYSLFLQVIEVETGAIRFQGEVTRSKQLKG